MLHAGAGYASRTMRSPIRWLALAIALQAFFAVLFLGCTPGPATRIRYNRDLCVALGGTMTELTEYRSRKGGWLLRSQYCTLEP